MNIKTITLICGGISTEHAISIKSAQNILKQLQQKYIIQVIYIDNNGHWLLLKNNNDLLNCTSATLSSKIPADPINISFSQPGKAWHNAASNTYINTDLIFPMLHGSNGEDGTMQGLLSLLRIPYIGADTLGAALCMNKTATKSMLQQAGIPVTPGITIKYKDIPDLEKIIAEYGLPLFVKPNNLGSSVGINRVTNSAELAAAITEAFLYDTEVLIETAIAAREIECAVLDGNPIQVATLSEINPTHNFYSYTAKYLDADGANFTMPANLNSSLTEKIQKMAITAFQCLHLQSYARIDFFIDKNTDAIYLNEVNTIPGFTPISMYPQMWAASGLSTPDLLDCFIELAVQRHAAKQELRLSPCVEQGEST